VTKLEKQRQHDAMFEGLRRSDPQLRKIYAEIVEYDPNQKLKPEKIKF